MSTMNYSGIYVIQRRILSLYFILLISLTKVKID